MEGRLNQNRIARDAALATADANPRMADALERIAACMEAYMKFINVPEYAVQPAESILVTDPLPIEDHHNE